MTEQEKKIRLDELHRVSSGANDASWKRNPSTGSDTINYWDFDYYIYLRECELLGRKPFDTYQEYFASQR